MKPIRALVCRSHGTVAWTGEVICDACGSVWWLGHDDPPGEGNLCTCGRALSGDNGTARAICHRCYLGKKRQHHAAGPS